jgi:hypothetical protein
VNVGAADKRQRDGLGGRQSRGQTGGSQSGDTGAADKVATSQIRIHAKQKEAAVFWVINCARLLSRRTDLITWLGLMTRAHLHCRGYLNGKFA